MNPTLVRSFQRTAVRMSDSAKTPTSKWAGYFVGITVLFIGGGAVLYKYNEENLISKNFRREGVNQKKPASE